MSDEPLCKHYLRGTCRFGDRCKFNHGDGSIKQQPQDQRQNFDRQSRRNPGFNYKDLQSDPQTFIKDVTGATLGEIAGTAIENFIQSIGDAVAKPENPPPAPRPRGSWGGDSKPVTEEKPKFERPVQRDNRPSRSQVPQRGENTDKRPNDRKKKNTESFKPSHIPADMRVLVEVAKGSHASEVAKGNTCKLKLKTQDVLVVPNLFCDEDDYSIYDSLLKEMEECSVENERLWKLWHGDTHLIADDHQNFKEEIPTFMKIIDKLRDYFNMDIKATRFNWYRDNKEWKPYHHDASAVDPKKAKIQNFTVGVSFGSTRDIAFEDAIEGRGHRRVVSFPLPNGTTYAFTRDINVNWRHGVPQLKDDSEKGERGRISIIAWGATDQTEA